MTPIKQTGSPCTTVSFTDCVRWTGDSVPCLGICNGDNLTTVGNSIATKVCLLADALDLSTVDLSCIIDLCGDCAENKSLKHIIQLLLENDCKLKQLIDAIDPNSGNSAPDILVNMKCLTKYDDFGNVIIQDLNATLQSLVNEVCAQAADIINLKSTVADLQLQIDSIDLTPTVDEPTITTCLTSPRPTSQAVVLIASDYCNFKGAIGTPVEVQQAMSLQPASLNQTLGPVDGWNLSPQDLAQSFGNLWIAYNDLLSRVTLIEENCCKVTCKDVVVGIEVIPNTDGSAISIKFSEAAGTFIPTGFTDCGSTLSITDKNGKVLSYPIVVAQNATRGDFGIIGLDNTANMTASVAVGLCAEGLSCEKCVSAEFNPNSGCPVCAITSTGTTGSVTIIYKS